MLWNWNCRYIPNSGLILHPISGVSNVNSPSTLPSSNSNRLFARKHIILWTTKFVGPTQVILLIAGEGRSAGLPKTQVCSEHVMKILTPGYLGQITRAPRTFLFRLGDLTWSGGLTWGDLVSKFSQNVRSKYPNSYTTNGCPAPRPVSAISEKPELALWNLLSKNKCCEKGRMGEAGSDLPSDLDYGNTYPTRCLVIALSYRRSPSSL